MASVYGFVTQIHTNQILHEAVFLFLTKLEYCDTREGVRHLVLKITPQYWSKVLLLSLFYATN